MSPMQQLAAFAVEQYFSNSFGMGGFAPFVVATDGLTGQQAATIPGERLNSVWMVVNHLTFTQNLFNRGLRGELTEPFKPVAPGASAHAWPALPEEINDANWLAARQQALDSNRCLAETIAALPDQQMNEPIPNLFNASPEQVILAVLAQTSYHTAEIITIRHMQGLRVNHVFA